MSRQVSIDIECPSCNGTGIYRGFAEPKGVGVVCLNCNGTGKAVLTYIPYDGRKSRTDVNTVQLSRGGFLAIGVGPVGESISYQEFLDGKLPKR